MAGRQRRGGAGAGKTSGQRIGQVNPLSGIPFPDFDALRIVSDIITLSGGGVAAIAFLREARQMLQSALLQWASREITIKADSVTVQLKGTNDIDKAIRALEKATEHEAVGRRAHQRIKEPKPDRSPQSHSQVLTFAA
jgi:hypothetical protein